MLRDGTERRGVFIGGSRILGRACSHITSRDHFFTFYSPQSNSMLITASTFTQAARYSEKGLIWIKTRRLAGLIIHFTNPREQKHLALHTAVAHAAQ